MKISSATHVGMKREVNQDSFKTELIDGGKSAFAIVCDGMGGMAAGNIASELAVKSIYNSFDNNLNIKASPSSICDLMSVSIKTANAVVYDTALGDKELTGMGTTVVAVVLTENNLSVAHAGDSRAYLFRNGAITQITTDHSIVQSMVESGHITPDEAEHHPNKNIITRAVGVHPDIDVDTNYMNIDKDDIILICTDGLTNCVDTNLLTETVKEVEFSKLADKLVDLANLNGGYDNITVVAIKND